MKLILRIAYLGKSYCGWQIQPCRPTVQGEICKAADRLFGLKCDVTGCSRTDSGVSANEFIAAVTEHGKPFLRTTMSGERISRALCALLPNDICVYGTAWADDGFHPRYDVKMKEYIYRIYARAEMSPFEAGRAYHCRHTVSEEALDRMRRASEYFVGEQDFTSFMATGSKITCAVRTVYFADVCRETDDNIIRFTVSANGFLYNMVRIMAGTLLQVERGRIAPYDIKEIITSRDRMRAGETAPAEGLYLNRVVYNTDLFE